MSRPSRGKEVLQIAKDYLGKARTVEELREVQAVVFPLEFGLTLEQTAQAIGKSVRWTSQIRSELYEEEDSTPTTNLAGEDAVART